MSSLLGIGDRRILGVAAERIGEPLAGMYAGTEDGFWSLRQRLMDEQNPQDIRVVIATRDVIPRERLIEEMLRLEALGVELLGSADGEHPLEDALAVDETHDSSDRADRIRATMARKAMRGVVLGRIPFGYRAGADGALEEEPDEARIVRSIFGMAADGKGIRSVVKELNAQGLLTRRGGAWSMITIRDMLRNRAYTGTYNRFGSRVIGNHPALVKATVFRSIQNRLDARAEKTGHGAGGPYLLSGAAVCGECGSQMVGVTRRQGWIRNDGTEASNVYRYYQCGAATSQSRCSYHTHRAAELDKLVISTLGMDRVAAGVTTAVDLRIANLAREAAKGRSSAQDVRTASQLLFHEADRLRDSTRSQGGTGASLDALLEAAADDRALRSLLRDALLQGIERVVVGEGDADVVVRH